MSSADKAMGLDIEEAAELAGRAPMTALEQAANTVARMNVWLTEARRARGRAKQALFDADGCVTQAETWLTEAREALFNVALETTASTEERADIQAIEEVLGEPGANNG